MPPLALATAIDAKLAGLGDTVDERSGLRAHEAAPAARLSVIAGKYRMERVLGEGGMGTIWQAFNLDLELPVAIKVLRPDLQSKELAERLRTEARAAAKLVHPSIVRVFDIGESDAGEPFIVMELLSGESLADVLDRGQLSPIDAVQLLLPIAEALSVAHARGVVHRDLKPDNIFLAEEAGVAQPKLLDFGIAKISGTSPGREPTLAGALLGSPDYMSPEQACGDPDIDHRSDVWSFCVVLYEALAGQAPFAAPTCRELLRSIAKDTPQTLEQLANIDRSLSALVQRGLEKAPERRHTSAFALGQALASWLMEQGVQEDAAGSSLAVKWFGASSDRISSSWRRSIAPASRAREGLVTLLSSPSPAPSLRRARRLRWIPASVVAATALLGGLAALRGMPVVGPSSASPAIDARVAMPAPPLAVRAISSFAPPPRTRPASVVAPTTTRVPVPPVLSAPTVLAEVAREPQQDLLAPY